MNVPFLYNDVMILGCKRVGLRTYNIKAILLAPCASPYIELKSKSKNSIPFGAIGHFEEAPHSYRVPYSWVPINKNNNDNFGFSDYLDYLNYRIVTVLEVNDNGIIKVWEPRNKYEKTVDLNQARPDCSPAYTITPQVGHRLLMDLSGQNAQYCAIIHNIDLAMLKFAAQNDRI